MRRVLTPGALLVTLALVLACAGPAATPTAAPTAAPTATPTAAPTATSTAAPTATSTAAPTATSTAAPTESPTAAPTDPPLPNVEGLVYTTVEAAMLAGYASASWSKTGIMGTFGGINIGGPVTDFMDGFVAGANYWNAQHDGNVRVLGWDPVTKTGSFTGNFDSTDDAKNLTITMLQEGADVILAVGGPIGQGTFAAIREQGADAVGLGVDVDWTLTVPDYADLMLTHILKRMDNSVFAAIERAMAATGDTGADFHACQISDTGGTDDKSFNQNAWDGMLRAQDELGIEIDFLDSVLAEDYARNINEFIGQDCDLIVTVGFLLGDDTKAAAIANPDQLFAIVDFAYPTSSVFVNTLANGGVDLGPFHEYDDQITDETKAELDTLRAAIIGGTVVPSDFFAAP